MAWLGVLTYQLHSIEEPCTCHHCSAVLVIMELEDGTGNNSNKDVSKEGT